MVSGQTASEDNLKSETGAKAAGTQITYEGQYVLYGVSGKIIAYKDKLKLKD